LLRFFLGFNLRMASTFTSGIAFTNTVRAIRFFWAFIPEPLPFSSLCKVSTATPNEVVTVVVARL
jgi:hypothetical protein